MEKTITFIPSSLHVVASGVDVTQDLNNTNNHSISNLLDSAYEKEEKNSKKD